MTRELLDKQQIIDGIRQLGPWFHKIELPYGLTTKDASMFDEPVDHPRSTWMHVKQAVPRDLSGKSVLDIGCNAGFYSFEARKRNASRVLGVEARSHHVRQARFVAAVNSVDAVEFQRMSLYELDPRTIGAFDVVLALGLVYHLKHLILGIERLYHVTGELLVIESAVITRDMLPDGFGSIGSDRNHSLSPLLYVRNSPAECEPAGNWFFPAPDTLVAMLTDVGFVDVSVVANFEGRTLISARKRETISDSTRPVWLDAELVSENGQRVARCGEEVRLSVRVRNTGLGKWLASGVDQKGTGAVNLDAQLTSCEDVLYAVDLPRVNVGRDMMPGDQCTLDLVFVAPNTPGRYELIIDMVAEHVAFFQDIGSKPLSLSLDVRA